MTQAETSANPRMLAIRSGKGGVGKSTVTANIAVAMADAGLRVGVVDADIYGPAIPRMLGVAAAKPAMSPDQKVVPAEAYGVKVMSPESHRPLPGRWPMARENPRLHQSQKAGRVTASPCWTTRMARCFCNGPTARTDV